MSPTQLALVPHGGMIAPDGLHAVALALQQQFIDVERAWGVNVIVTAFERYDDMPEYYWPIIVIDNASLRDGQHFFNHDNFDRPYAWVKLSEGWPMAASHEAIEMAIDPEGHRTINGRSLADRTRSAKYLVEPCDPCQHAGYPVNGITLSNFCTPAFYQEGAPGPYDRLSYIDAPLKVLRWGYLSWQDGLTHRWLQREFNDIEPHDVDLGLLNSTVLSMRSQMDLAAQSQGFAIPQREIHRRKAVERRGRVRSLRGHIAADMKALNANVEGQKK